MRNTKHEVLHYAVFSSLLWLPPSYNKISSSLFSDTFILCSSSNVGVVGCVWHWMLRLWAGMWCLAVGRLVSLFLLPLSPAGWTLEDNVFLIGTDASTKLCVHGIMSLEVQYLLYWNVWMLLERRQRNLYWSLTGVLCQRRYPCSYHEDMLGELRYSSTHS